ncbi:Sir2 family NAD-dependent protein deacetylase, partial [Staphylococcus epidermidis]|uniref:Sir2 family NAD-dependent protein deacetylase n=1 Tax=Staphylococcus epidermidis TaxID=1282 RepID=UPI0028CBBBEA
IPSFYHQISKHPHSPHYFLTIHHLHHNKQTFINFYHQTLLIPHKKPNILHQSIPQLQNHQKSLPLITQNIHPLHEDPGTRNIHHL